MSTVLKTDEVSLPNHLDLPDTDGLPLENSIEQIQNLLLTDSLLPILNELHPDGQYFIGHDVGIYFYVKPKPVDSQEALKGCRAPDWFYVPDVSPVAADGDDRRSYVLKDEDYKVPYLIIEQVSAGEGKTERDRADEGKMGIYERKLKTPYYAIFDGFRKKTGKAKLEVYRLVNDRYVAQQPDVNGRFLIPKLNVLLGFENQVYANRHRPWLRFYDRAGKLLLGFRERTEVATQQAEAERKARLEAVQQAEAEAQRAEAERKARLEAEEKTKAVEAELAQLKKLLLQQQARSSESEAKE
jgi:Uma2 family endonuclease